MLDYKTRELEYSDILDEIFEPDKNYNEDELILLLENCVNFQIYQAKSIIDLDPDNIESFDKFIYFCKNIIAIRELIERDFNFCGILIYNYQRIIYDFIKDREELVNKQSPQFQNFENFIVFFGGYFIDKYIGKKECNFIIEKIINNIALLQDASNIRIEELTCSLSFFELGRKYFNEIELENLDSKFPKSQIFIENLKSSEPSSRLQSHHLTSIHLCDKIKNKHLDNVIFNNQNFLEILKKNQMNIAFERAIYLTLFDNNLHEYFLDLEERIENYKSKNEIFLMEDESLIEFREFIEKLEKAKIKEEFSRPKTNPIFINRNKLNIDSFLRLQQIEGSKTP